MNYPGSAKRKGMMGMLNRLLYSGPEIEVLHEEYAKEGFIDAEAPVKSTGGIRIEAPVERVWELLINLPEWETWAPDVRDVHLDSKVAEDARFTWAIGRTRINSKFAIVEPGRELTWTGTALWTKAIDRHLLEPTDDGATLHYIEESLAGVLVPLFFSSVKLKAQHHRWLMAFKTAAEGR